MIDLCKQFLLLVLFVANTNYGMAAPFLPTYLAQKGVSTISTGVIFGIFSVAGAIASLFAGKFVDGWGHKPLLIGSQVFLAVTVACFGLIERLEDENMIITACIGLRIGQGAAYGVINTVIDSFASQVYADDIDQVVAIMEGVAGIGMIVSPVLGIYVYTATGFATTFYIFGAASVPSTLLAIWMPKPKQHARRTSGYDCGDGSENKEVEFSPERSSKVQSVGARRNATSQSSKEQQQTTYSALICEKRILFATIAALVESIVDYILEPILSLRIEDYDVPSWVVGPLYASLALTFTVGTFILTCALPSWMPYRVTIISSLLLLGVSFSLIGPPFESENFVTMVVGLSLTGLFMSSTVIPIMPEMLEAGKHNFAEVDEDHASSLLSGIYNAAFGIGQALGPIVGTFLYQLIGFRFTMQVATGLIILTGLLYLLCANGCEAFQSIGENYRNRNLASEDGSQMHEKTSNVVFSHHFPASSRCAASVTGYKRRRFDIARSMSEDERKVLAEKSSLLGSCDKDSKAWTYEDRLMKESQQSMNGDEQTEDQESAQSVANNNRESLIVIIKEKH